MKYKLMPEEPTEAMRLTFSDEFYYCPRERVDAFAAAYRAMWQAAPDGWISVCDRLPDNHTQVLVYCPAYPSPYVTDEIDDTGCWCENPENVTHWMPLPEPPKE